MDTVLGDAHTGSKTRRLAAIVDLKASGTQRHLRPRHTECYGSKRGQPMRQTRCLSSHVRYHPSCCVPVTVRTDLQLYHIHRQPVKGAGSMETRGLLLHHNPPRSSTWTLLSRSVKSEMPMDRGGGAPPTSFDLFTLVQSYPTRLRPAQFDRRMGVAINNCGIGHSVTLGPKCPDALVPETPCACIVSLTA